MVEVFAPREEKPKDGEWTTQAVECNGGLDVDMYS